ncbi:hypothetical protein Lesp02_11450 [Lentzea sp. NBRC 105346]|uniref:fibronectin type III domain-containing protein n=1 Tax=Lentzea sp. NBRC 105346 TaxID=3032205 RepID=UPI0024A45F82|nr:fibronectin type III domain-containing protein [Lentzea sp. NBRC 105346]GLZ28955.1 hypothetical protein Lesp02_11450 [Lentzea sp. NBRC 105346]
MTRILAVLLLFLAACGQEQRDLHPNDPALKSTLTSPTNVKLDWQPVPGAAGQVVEYANEQNGEFVILGFVPSGQSTFTHPDLIPETNFYYRVRPYTGPASGEVEVSLPPGDEVSESDGHDWAPPKADGQGTHPLPAPEAAPSGLSAVIKHANGILFTWTDNASDEQGYLLEIKPAGATDYRIAAQLDPNVTSFGLVTLPEEKQASYRVRPYRFGEPSNLVHETTGKS